MKTTLKNIFFLNIYFCLLNKGAIIGIIIGVLILSCCISICAYSYKRKRRLEDQQRMAAQIAKTVRIDLAYRNSNNSPNQVSSTNRDIASDQPPAYILPKTNQLTEIDTKY